MKKKIQITYEVTSRVSVDVEVDEIDYDNLINTKDLDVLKKYDIRDDILWERAMDEGWTESDWCVTGDNDAVLIPWYGR